MTRTEHEAIAYQKMHEEEIVAAKEVVSKNLQDWSKKLLVDTIICLTPSHGLIAWADEIRRSEDEIERENLDRRDTPHFDMG